MGHLLDGRRRMIRSRGHLITLRKIVPNAPPVDVTLMAFDRAYRPEEIQGAVKAGDRRIETLAEELDAAEWGAPAHPQKVIDGGRMSTIGGAWPVREGEVIIGWSLWATSS